MPFPLAEYIFCIASKPLSMLDAQLLLKTVQKNATATTAHCYHCLLIVTSMKELPFLFCCVAGAFTIVTYILLVVKTRIMLTDTVTANACYIATIPRNADATATATTS